MRVLHLSTNDLRGGASKSMYRLHRGLLAEGVESKVGCFYKQSEDASVIKLDWRSQLTTKIEYRLREYRVRARKKRFLDERPEGAEMFSDWLTPLPHSLLKPHIAQADIVNLHWVNAFVDIREFFRILAGKVPVIWRLSDMNPFTGGCHYDQECGRFLNGCGCCPQLNSSSPNDLSARIFERNRKVFDALETRAVRFVLQSHWMARCLESHPFLSRFARTVIPNGIDSSVFEAAEKAGSGIPETGKVNVLIVAGSLNDRRKGGAAFIKALKLLDGNLLNRIHLVSVGVHDLKPGLPSLSYTSVGKVENYHHLATIYAASDVVVVPSLQDNLPSSVLEAMAAGCGIIASDVGGIPDMVRNEKEALLFKPSDPASIAQAMKEMVLNVPLRSALAHAAKLRVKEHFSLRTQVAAYREYYADTLEQFGKTRT
jgi:glycosyltransferase involved in cell wall biosynthesis